MDTIIKTINKTNKLRLLNKIFIFNKSKSKIENFNLKIIKKVISDKTNI